MTAPKGLRPVGDGERAPKPKVKSVKDAAAGGDQLELLVAMRDRIATAVTDPKCPPRDLASLTKRLSDISEQIKALEEAKEADGDRDQEPPEAFDAAAL